MNLLKRICNLWKLSEYEPTLYVKKSPEVGFSTNMQQVEVKLERPREFKSAEIIYKKKPIENIISEITK